MIDHLKVLDILVYVEKFHHYVNYSNKERIMSEDVFRPSRKKISSDEIKGEPMEQDTPNIPDPLSKVREVQNAIHGEFGGVPSNPMPMQDNPDLPFQIGGNVPPEFRAALQRKAQEQSQPKVVSAPPSANFPPQMQNFDHDGQQPKKRPQRRAPTPDNMIQTTQSSELAGMLAKLEGETMWEEFEFPSLGKFYANIPPVIHVRPMTGEEEQILATPRFVRRGKAIDMIFSRCIKENIDTSKLLSVDRTHLLIYLRGISYTPEYDVEIKCPECTTKFSTTIDLNMLDVTTCPNDFGPDSLEGELPHSGFMFSYHLATGLDEQNINNYREKRIQMFGDQSEDDTFLYRTAVLLNNIENIRNPKELQVLLKRLPIADVAYLRNEVNDPPFGVNTEVPLMCPSCAAEFEIDLPLETNFFFPRKKEKTQA
jgi:hypothetical protein